MHQHTGLIVAAHGSRRAESNEEIKRFAQNLATTLEQIHFVAPAFLELATPSIADAIQNAITAGCREIIVVPYFLAAGRHVIKDVPAIVAQCQQENPEIKIRLTQHLGVSQGLQAAVRELL